MALAALCALMLVSLPPQLDADATLSGARVESEALAELPHAPQTSEVLPLLISPVELTYGGGGLDLGEGLLVSLHGSSYTQLRYLWGGLELTHPARAGRPMLDLPTASWQTLRLGDLWSTSPTLQWLLAPPARRAPSAWVHLALGVPAGNSSWVPPHVFDRDPAYAYGAPKERRGIRQRAEVTGHVHVPLAGGSVFAVGEHIEQRQRFVTLTPLDEVERNSIVLLWQRLWAGWPLAVHGAWQHQSERFSGAAWRVPAPYTHASSHQAGVLGLEVQRRFASDMQLRMGLGGGVAVEQQTPSTAGLWTSDVAEGADTLAPLLRPAHTTSGFVGAHAGITFGSITPLARSGLPPANERTLAHLRASAHVPAQVPAAAHVANPTLSLTARGRWAGWQRSPAAGVGPLGETWLGNPVRLKVFDPPSTSTTQLVTAHVASHLTLPVERQLTLHMMLGLDGGARPGAYNPQGFFAGSLGFAAVKQWRGGFQSFASLRQDPEAITAEYADFQTPGGEHGRIFAWQGEDEDVVAKSAPLLDVFGAPHHRLAPSLKRPQHTRFTLGARSPAFYGMHVGLRGTAHFLWQRYEVKRLSRAQQTPQAFRDPGGDGRGEATRNGQTLSAVSEAPLLSPDDVTYELQNSSQPSHYLGVELELQTAQDRMFFASLWGAAYLSAGAAPFGQGPFRNDPGVISEAEGSSNQRVHGWGRYDHDRAFALKLQAGVRPRRNLSLALAARYRDGQPTTRIVIDDALAQGPTPLMAVARGKPRYTFRMSFDARLSWALSGRLAGFKLICDVYNIFGSATEISEDMRTGSSFRRATEAVPGRSVWVALEGSLTP